MGIDVTDLDGASSSILPPGQSFGNMLRHVNRLIQRDLGVRVASLGITLPQWYALRTLWISDGLTQIELAQKSGVAGPAMVFAVRSLLAMELVVRKRHPHDRRKYVIFLTDKGRQLEEPALQAAIEVNDAATAGLAPGELEQCLAVLRLAYRNLIGRGIPQVPEDLDELIE